MSSAQLTPDLWSLSIRDLQQVDQIVARAADEIDSPGHEIDDWVYFSPNGRYLWIDSYPMPLLYDFESGVFEDTFGRGRDFRWSADSRLVYGIQEYDRISTWSLDDRSWEDVVRTDYCGVGPTLTRLAPSSVSPVRSTRARGSFALRVGQRLLDTPRGGRRLAVRSPHAPLVA